MNNLEAAASDGKMRFAVAANARRKAVIAIALLCAFAAAEVRAQDRSAYSLVATKLMLKVLTYDKAFANRGTGDFVVLVATEPGQAAERAALMDALTKIGITSILSRPLKFAVAEYTGKAAFDARVRETSASAVLVLSGISPAAADAIGSVSSNRGLYALGTDESLVERGFVLGVTNNNGKPQIVINLQSSRAIGATFEQSILKLARVVH